MSEEQFTLLIETLESIHFALFCILLTAVFSTVMVLISLSSKKEE